MLIINGGMPRSGTVLVGNLVRLMLEHRGIAWQRYNPQERRHLQEFLNLAQQRFDGAIIVHTHLIDEAIVSALQARDDAVLIWNHRDPRDALISLVRLHDLSLERGLYAMNIYGAATETARTSPDCLTIKYEALVADVPGHINMLAHVLRFDMHADELETLVEQTSAKAHARIMGDLQRGQQLDGRQIPTMTRVLREDPKTLVNDRHIQSGKSGRWRHELTPEAQEQATKALSRWIEFLGYAQPDSVDE